MKERKVTEKSLRELVEKKKEYLKTGDKKLLEEINDFIENVINVDGRYFSKLSSYNFSSEDLKFLM